MEFVKLESVSSDIDYGLTESATDEDTGHKFLRITDIRDGSINWNEVPFCECSVSDTKKYELHDGDIVFARTGSVGNTSLVTDAPKGSVFASYLIRIRPNQKYLDPFYLSCFFQTPNYWRQIEAGAVGAIQGGVNASKLKELDIPLPPLPEQHRIAALLRRADDMRRRQCYADGLSASLLQSVFLEMFGKNSTEFPKTIIQDIACDSKYALSSGPFGSNLTSEHYLDNGVIVLRGLNISDKRLNLKDIKYISEQKAKSLERSEIHPGDIVVVAVGSSGLACLIPDTLPRAIMSQNFNKITPDTKKVNAVYLEHCLNSKYVQKQFGQEITDTVRTFLSLTKLKSVEIPLPPLPEQERFARIVQRVEALRGRQAEARRQADGLFQSLLAQSFEMA